MSESWTEKASDLWQRFKDGMAEVILSLAGSVGIIAGISAVQSLNDSKLTVTGAFNSYFEGGQVGLTVLAVGGAALGTLLRQPKGDRLWSVLILLILLTPIIGTSFIVGGNPGFKPGELTENTLRLLWFFYILVHVLWLLFIIRTPNIPNPQEAGAAASKRVDAIKRRAAGRA